MSPSQAWFHAPDAWKVSLAPNSSSSLLQSSLSRITWLTRARTKDHEVLVKTSSWSAAETDERIKGDWGIHSFQQSWKDTDSWRVINQRMSRGLTQGSVRSCMPFTYTTTSSTRWITSMRQVLADISPVASATAASISSSVRTWADDGSTITELLIHD